MYNEAAITCAAEKDQISKQLFEELLEDEEGHLDMFENIKDHVDNLELPISRPSWADALQQDWEGTGTSAPLSLVVFT